MPDLSILTVVDGEDAVITALYDAAGEETESPQDAVCAVGQYLTGSLAGWWFVLNPFNGRDLTEATVH